jgi:hypothetical protein
MGHFPKYSLDPRFLQRMLARLKEARKLLLQYYSLRMKSMDAKLHVWNWNNVPHATLPHVIYLWYYHMWFTCGCSNFTSESHVVIAHVVVLVSHTFESHVLTFYSHVNISHMFTCETYVVHMRNTRDCKVEQINSHVKHMWFTWLCFFRERWLTIFSDFKLNRSILHHLKRQAERNDSEGLL